MNEQPRETDQEFQYEQWTLENPLVREFLGHVAQILAEEYVELMKVAPPESVQASNSNK